MIKFLAKLQNAAENALQFNRRKGELVNEIFVETLLIEWQIIFQ